MLAATIDSARAGGTDPEIIVVDDASTDDTAALCAGMPHITYQRLPMQSGTAAARNHGIAVAHGEFVALLDDDDLRLPNTFLQQLTALKLTRLQPNHGPSNTGFRPRHRTTTCVAGLLAGCAIPRTFRETVRRSEQCSESSRAGWRRSWRGPPG